MGIDTKNFSNYSADEVKNALDSLFEDPCASQAPKGKEKGVSEQVAAKAGDSYKAPDNRLSDILLGGSTPKAKQPSFGDLAKQGVDFKNTKLSTSDETGNAGMLPSQLRMAALHRRGISGEHKTSAPESKETAFSTRVPKYTSGPLLPEYGMGPSGIQGAGFDGQNYAERGLGLFLLRLDASVPTDK